ncbi:hypothetical protein [Psychrobacter ciconiae]|uniref:hypothetical protein n=1 Tax=Psychrobacter ciconiae TaxID=1553449 RepID=UPI001D1199FC|nr:hypothetical protein [Psychrobacter ciconiae]
MIDKVTGKKIVGIPPEDVPLDADPILAVDNVDADGSSQDPRLVNNEEAVVVRDPALSGVENPKGSYAGRKHLPNIDGPEQASQETDEVYSDPRKEEDLPPGGKNVGDLNAFNLGKEDNL